MNERKVALFVEGLTEQVFVRDFLIKWYDWDTIEVGLDCFTLNAGNEHSAPYPYGTVDSKNYYQIFNIGNDNSVLSVMIDRADRLQNAGYTLVVGLRDMFNKVYHQKTFEKNNQRVIDQELNQKFIQSARESIEASAKQVDLCLLYAIMEVESWLLGMPKYMGQLQNITDPETEIYHPAAKLAELRTAEGLTYDKHRDEIESIVGDLTKDDYLALLQSGKCQSFRTFVTTILGIDNLSS
jgi:hypothetical protein